MIVCAIIHHPYCSNHRTKPNKLHHWCEHLVQTVFISYSGMAHREICKLWVLQIARWVVKCPLCRANVDSNSCSWSARPWHARWTHLFVPSSSMSLEIQDSSLSMHVNVVRMLTHRPMVSSCAPTKMSSVSPAALTWPMVMKYFYSVSEFDGSYCLAWMRALRVGVKDEMGEIPFRLHMTFIPSNQLIGPKSVILNCMPISSLNALIRVNELPVTVQSSMCDARIKMWWAIIAMNTPQPPSV